MSFDFPYDGRRVKLIFTTDPYTDLRAGDTGTVEFIDGAGILDVKWDNGSTLRLLPGTDAWEIMKEAEDGSC